MEIQKYTIAGINLLFVFKDFNLRYLQKELGAYSSKFKEDKADITLSFIDNIKNLDFIRGGETHIDTSTYFSKSDLFVGGDYFYMLKYPFSYVVKRNNKKYEIFISKQKPSTIIEKFHRHVVRNDLLSPSFITDGERLASNIIYDFINNFLELLFVENGGTFIHASCVSDGNKAILMPALGGVGKTTLSSKFVLKKNFKFIADDLTIVRNKKCHTNLTHLFVYPYNKDLVSKIRLSSFDKVKWSFYKTMRIPPLRLRRSPEVVYGADNIALTPKKISKIFFLEKGNFDSLTSSKIPSGLLHSKTKNILLDEFRSLIDLIISVNSIKTGILPSLEEFLKKLDYVIKENLKGFDAKIVKIPLDETKIYNYVYKLYKEKK